VETIKGTSLFVQSKKEKRKSIEGDSRRNIGDIYKLK